MEPVLKKAMEHKIVVITHEASDIQNANYDIEAFDNKSYGEHLMEALAKLMNYEGEYAVYVGSLTSKTHNEWVDAAVALQKSKYPKMKLVADKIETNDDQQVAYAKTKELLRAHPNVKGFEGSASTDVAGIGLAVEEAGMEDKTAVVGTSLPSIAKKYLPTGAVDMISFWDPADAGYVANKIAVMVFNGQKITDGMDLGVKGYDKVKLAQRQQNLWPSLDRCNQRQFESVRLLVGSDALRRSRRSTLAGSGRGARHPRIRQQICVQLFNFVGRMPDRQRRYLCPTISFGFDPRGTYLQDVHPRAGAQGRHLNRRGSFHSLPGRGKRIRKIYADQNHRRHDRCRPRISVDRRPRRDTREPPSPYQPRPQRHLPGFLSVAEFIGLRKYYLSRQRF